MIGDAPAVGAGDFRGSFVQLFDSTDPLRSEVTLFVASLLALGIGQHGPSLFHCTFEHLRGETQFHSTWTLAGASRDGRFDTVKMQKAWDDGLWLCANPKHPLAILRNGLTYQRAFSYTPRFTLAELARIETPDTWLEAAIRNLIWLLREMPRCIPEGIVRFGPRHAAMVPKSLPEKEKTRFLRYVEHPGKRAEILRSAA
jgi:hypothetical protein